MKTNSPLYKIFSGMKTRCYNMNSCNYYLYGARGITICDEWLNNPDDFYKWAMENGYSEGLSIERIDVNGNYCPLNCKWATMKEQANNKRNNRNLTIDGVTKTIAQWAEDSGLHYVTIHRRLFLGWEVNDELLKPVGNEMLTINGETKSIVEWAKENNMDVPTLRARVRKGWPDEKLLNPVRHKKRKCLKSDQCA